MRAILLSIIISRQFDALVPVEGRVENDAPVVPLLKSRVVKTQRGDPIELGVRSNGEKSKKSKKADESD